MSDLAATVDVAVVGGGIMGTSLAWHLARRGVRNVALFERGTVAAGASGRTGALLRQHYTNVPEATLAHESLQVFRHWPDVVGGDCGFVQSGLVVTVSTGPGCEVNLDLLRRNVALQNRIGIAARVITPAELLNLQPYLRVDDVAAVAYEPASGYVDAITATRSMARAAIREGARVVEHCPVLGIELEGDRVRGVSTPDGIVSTDTVVCAAGPWSAELLTTIGIDVPLTALRVQVAVLQQPLDLNPPHFAYVDTAAGIFFRPWGEGRTLIGVGGGEQHDAVDPDAFEPRNDPSYPQLAIDALSRRIPAMAGATFLHGHAGLYDMTPDAHPILGPVGPDGLYLMLGFSGAGFKKAPAVAHCLADLITDGHARLVDLTPFRLDRFATDGWRNPWSDTEYVFVSDFGHRF